MVQPVHIVGYTDKTTQQPIDLSTSTEDFAVTLRAITAFRAGVQPAEVTSDQIIKTLEEMDHNTDNDGVYELKDVADYGRHVHNNTCLLAKFEPSGPAPKTQAEAQQLAQATYPYVRDLTSLYTTLVNTAVDHVQGTDVVSTNEVDTKIHSTQTARQAVWDAGIDITWPGRDLQCR